MVRSVAEQFTLTALLYTATITPYEVCLLWEGGKQDILQAHLHIEYLY